MRKSIVVSLCVLGLLPSATKAETETASAILPQAQPFVEQVAPKPVPKLVCKTGAVIVKDGKVAWTGGCTYRSRPVGKVTWVSPVTNDATGTVCQSTTTSGSGKTFTPVPSARITPVFTLRVPKTRFYRAKVLRVGGRTLIAGWDSCGTPLPVSSLPLGDSSPLCVYTAPATFDAATRTLRFGGIACPSSFGACSWQPVPSDKWYSPAPGVTIYGSVVWCANGNTAITYASLNGGCIRINATGAFVLPPFWGGGWVYWNVTLLTVGLDFQPVASNVVDPSDPRWNGFTPYQPIEPVVLPGTRAICP